MAKYDYGGGCPCGLYAECEEECEFLKKGLGMVTDNDFGFSIVDETELTRSSHNDKVVQLRAMIMPLLTNLKANPDKDIIKWNGADRVNRINDFIEKMDDLINS